MYVKPGADTGFSKTRTKRGSLDPRYKKWGGEGGGVLSRYKKRGEGGAVRFRPDMKSEGGRGAVPLAVP